MRFLSILFVGLLLSLIGCQPAPSGNDRTTPTVQDSLPSNPDTAEVESYQQPLQRQCPEVGSLLEGNRLVVEDLGLEVLLVADSATADPELGPSHRRLLVRSLEDCAIRFERLLPVDRSPDYPYHLSDITYNKAHRLVALRGFSRLYVLDLEALTLSPPLQPRFLNERYAEDAQSGAILRLEVWEDYLVGYARDMGTFVFRLTGPQRFEAVMPFAEFEVLEGERYNSLFLLSTDDGRVQGLFPEYDFKEKALKLNPLFSSPVELSTNVPRSARNNRFLVLRHPDGRALALDLLQKEKVELPEALKAAPTREVLEWLQQNRR